MTTGLSLGCLGTESQASGLHVSRTEEEDLISDLAQGNTADRFEPFNQPPARAAASPSSQTFMGDVSFP